MEKYAASRLRLALIERAQDGNRSAMGRLFEEYTPFLMAVITKLMGPKLRRTLEPADVVQETLLAATTCFENFKGDETELRAWLATLARNRLADLARHNGRLKRALKGEVSLHDARTASGGSLIELLKADQCTASQVAVKEELSNRLAKALTVIDPRQAAALHMRYSKGMTFDSIGQQMGKSRNSVRTLIARGLRNLRCILPPT